MRGVRDRIAQLTPAQRALLSARLGQGDAAHPRRMPLPVRTRSGNNGVLSFAQERMWFLEQLTPGTAVHHVALGFKLAGPLNEQALTVALTSLAARHDVLRTSFPAMEGRPRAIVSPPGPVPLEIRDLRHLNPLERLNEAHRLDGADAASPFELARVPLFRATLLRLAPDDHVLLLTFHHLIVDGESTPLIMREVAAGYSAYLERGAPVPPPMSFQYADFAAWQRESLDGSVRADLLAYWREQLAGAPAVLELPFDRPRPAIQLFSGALYPLELPADLAVRVHRLAKEENVTPFMVLLAAFQTLLARISGQSDIVVGTPAAHRGDTVWEPLVGCFINMLPLRTRFDDDPSPRTLLGRVRGTCVSAYANQDLPFELLVDALQPTRSLRHAPVFQTLLTVQPTLPNRFDFAGLSAEPFDRESGAAKFDLSVLLMDRKATITGVIEYNSALFERRTVGRLASHFRTLLDHFVDAPETPVSELALLTNSERTGILRGCEAASPVVSTQDLIHEIVARQAARTPTAAAVTCEERSISYAELDRRANQLARWLRSRGIAPEQRVGVCLDRSVEVVVVLLAVLKAGGAYLPLDPTHPSLRLAYLLSDAGAILAITDRKHRDRLESYPGPVECLEDIDDQVSELPADAPPNQGSAANLAYVIYTSGSTGVPKGVAVSHSSVVSLFNATSGFFQFDERDVWTCFHSTAFDFSVWEMWGALIHGARLVIVPHLVSRSPESFYALLREKGVTVLSQTPSAFYRLAAVDESSKADGDLALRWVVFGGEMLEPAFLAPWFGRHGEEHPRLINMYGITEITVHGTLQTVGSCDLAGPQASMIGSALPNTRIFVLDRHLEPAPRGVVGEIYVGGAGLARGYLGRPSLTAERFLPDPFGPPGSRLYRSGDLARVRDDGKLECLGRRDQQIKVRGFRIELRELETALMRLPSVREAAVVPVGQGDERWLVAYLKPISDYRPGGVELRRMLRVELPDYMLPDAYVWLDEFPVTANGKLDRRALPAPSEERPDSDRPYSAPATPVEEALGAIWEHVLGVARVGRHDNFFELGGDSIRSLKVLTLARQHGLGYSVQDLFQHQTIASLGGARTQAADLAHTAPGPFALVDPADRSRLDLSLEDAYPLAQMQAGMLYHMQLTPDLPDYHNVNSYHLSAPFDLESFQTAADYVVARHPVLRTSFDLTGFRQPLQLVHREARLEIGSEDIRHLPPAEQEQAVLGFVEREAHTPFDLSRPPLFRLHFHRRGETTFQLTITDFHPLLDGWSLHTVLAEWFDAYFAALAGQALPPPSPPASSFREFIALEQAALESSESREFWADQLLGASVARLPRWPTAARLASAGRSSRVGVPIDPSVAERLRKLARNMALPLKTVLLAAHLRVLALVTGQGDILTGIVTHGRLESPDGDRACGLFLNTLPLRMHLPGGTWQELMRATFEAEWRALPHRRYPLAAMPHESGGRDLPFEVAFNYVHFHVIANLFASERVQSLGFAAISEPSSLTLAVTFHADPVSALLNLILDYRTEELTAEQVRSIAGYYAAALEAIARDPGERYDSACLLPQPERRLLEEWNATEMPLDSGCLHERIAEQAARTPDAVAAACQSALLCYGELERRANQLAHLLTRLGVGPDVPVAVCLDRSLELVIALVAVLKAGGAYLPLDPGNPPARLAFSIADSHAPVLLTTANLEAHCGTFSGKVVCLDNADAELVALPVTPPPVRVHPGNLAYVIYTSGSTGVPKAVAVPHVAVLNLLADMAARLGVSVDDRFLAVTPISFDIAALEIFLPLFTGAQLALASRYEAGDGHLLAEAARRHRATILQATPGTWRLLLGADASAVDGLVCLCGGEAWPADLAAQLRPRAARLWNMYGPTETTIWSAAHLVESVEVAPPIGRPLANTQLYILDQYGEPAPVGTPGELYIGGLGLARGYIRRPALAAERFVPDPLSKQSGARRYRTGDLARRLPHGTIEFLGRLDYQVKIRGFRIELGEIEAASTHIAGVREAILIATGPDRADGADRRLIAYLLPSGADRVTVDVVRRELQASLPDYMLPSAVVWVEAWPLTANGKIDRAALPAPDADRPELEPVYIAPRTAIEVKLAGLWAGVLQLERVGVDDNFFALGGDSIRAIQLIARVREVFGVDVPLRRLFDRPTVAELAPEIAIAGGNATPPLEGRPEGAPPEPLLSYVQERMWFLEQLTPGTPAYHMPLALRLKGELDVAALKAALTALVTRHEVLRTSFPSVEGRPVAVVHPPAPFPLAIRDLQSLSASERLNEAHHLAAVDVGATFALADGPLLRATLLRLEPKDHVFLLTLHHMVTDGASTELILNELAEGYRAFLEGRAPSVALLPVQYSDFASWQRRCLDAATRDSLLSYWRVQMAGAPTVLELPADRSRPAIQLSRGGFYSLELAQDVTVELHRFARREALTPFMILLAALQASLARFSGQTDIVVGAPVSQRTQRTLEPLIGCFINTLPLRTKLDDDPSGRTLLARVKEACLAAQAHRDLPFELLVEALQPERSLSHAPIFQVLFALQGARKPLPLPGLIATEENVDRRASQCDLALTLEDGDARIAGGFEYDSDLFNAQTIARFAGSFQSLLQDLLGSPDRPVSEYSLLTDAERRRLLEAGCSPVPVTTQSGCLPQWISRQATRTPESIAITAGATSVTYADLERRANQLAHKLRALQVGPEIRVAICFERSPELVIAMLAIWKAGGAYVPLDPNYPAQRMAFILADSTSSLLLTTTAFRPQFAVSCGTVLCLDLETNELERQPDSPPAPVIVPGNLAYVIYTSGSTGMPKGVAVSHGAIANLAAAMTAAYRLTQADRVLQFASPAFDVAAEEIFPTLIAGAAVVIHPPTSPDPATDSLLWSSAGVTVLNLPAAYWKRWSQSIATVPPCVRLVIAGSERVLSADYRIWKRGPGAHTAFVNAYGTTETTITALFFEPPCGDSENYTSTVPVGRPIAAARAYVLDRHLQPVPVGVVGELYIGGAGVARGYLANPHLTAEKFVPDPYGAPGLRLYRTGDVARWSAAGDLELLGRKDRQMKIRSFRVEPGEIESALNGHPDVQEALVTARDGATEKRLVAYLVASGEIRPGTDQLRQHLLTTLPSYMVPATFAWVVDLPINQSGKIDETALPSTDSGSSPAATPVHALSPLQEAVAAIWSDLLEIETIGIDDNFFAIGGQSLIAAQLAARLRDAFHIDLPLRTIFDRPTIKSLSEEIQSARRKDGHLAGPTLAATHGTRFPLSVAQEQIWRLQQALPASSCFHIPLALRLTGPLDVPALERAITAMMRRHPMLRTRIEVSGDRPVQVVAELVRAFSIPLLDLTSLVVGGDPESALSQVLVETTNFPFELGSGPPFRAVLVRLGPEEHVLVLTLHHIAADGYSMGIFCEEMAAIYISQVRGEDARLPELTMQYGDFVVWESQWIASASGTADLEYWRRQLSGSWAGIPLPGARPRPQIPTYHYRERQLLLDKRISGALRSLARQEGASIFMSLLAGLIATLNNYHSQEEMVIGTLAANRTQMETDRVIGPFLNTLVLRIKSAANDTMRDLLHTVRDATLEAFDHQTLPFNTLLDSLSTGDATASTFQFPIMFSVHQRRDPMTDIPGLKVQPVSTFVDPHGSRMIPSTFDLVFDVIDGGGVFQIVVNYRIDVIDGEKVDALLKRYAGMLQQMVEQIRDPIDRLIPGTDLKGA